MLAAAVGGAVAACAPRCRSLCCRLMASALFGMRAAPSRRNGGPRPSSALPLNRARRPRFADGGVRWGQSLRARCGVPLRPPVPAGRRRPWPAAGASSVVSRPCPVRAAVGRLRSRRPRRRPRPRRSARATKVGGLLQRPLAAAPLRRRAPPLQPRPRFWPRGGAILVSLRRVWGLRRLRAALKVYRAARAAQCKCGVHGFAMNPYVSLRLAAAPYYREARVTVVWRQSACGMRHRWRSPHCGDWR